MYSRQHLTYGCGLFILLAITLVVYWEGLEGGFLVDDLNNLAALNHNGGVVNWNNFLYFVFGNNSGVLGRPLSMLSFLINDQYYPGDVSSYRYTNLMIHCLCGLGLFALFRRFLLALGWLESKALMTALLATAWWLLTPMSVSTTLYVIQRMTQLSAAFMIFGLLAFLIGRERLCAGHRSGVFWVLAGLYGAGGLAILSKENGALIFVYAAVLEMTLCYARNERSNLNVKALIVLPILLMVAYFIVNWHRSVGAYASREFTLGERLLTELRIVGGYIVNSLFSLTAKMGLMQDDIVVSKSLFSPLSTIAALFFHLILWVMAWVNRRSLPLLLFGVAWFYAGHILESTFIPLELYFEHRNYLPLAGFFLSIVALLWHAVSYRKLARIVLCLLLLQALISCSLRAALWGDPKQLMDTWIYEHPRSLRAQTIHARNLIEIGMNERAYQQLVAMRSHWPEAFHVNLLLLNQKCLGQMQVEESVEELLGDLEGGVYSSQLDYILKNTANLARDGICPEVLTGIIHPLLKGINNVDKVHNKVLASAALFDYEIYVKEYDLNGAMAALERSFNYYNDSPPHYLRAKALASAGLYKESLRFIRMAIDFEEAKPVYKRKNVVGYKRLEKKIMMGLEVEGDLR